MPTGYKQQTDIQDAKTFRIGSVKFEIGPYGGGYSDVGALEDANAVESWDDVVVKSDNAGDIENGITGHIVTVSAIWKEINVANLAIAFAGLGSGDTTTTDPVSPDDEAVVLTTFGLSELAYKNGDGTEVTAITVDNAAAGTVEYVRDCDYVIVTKENGYTAIARGEAASIITESVLIAVTTTHTITLSTPSFDNNIAVGDHLTMSGFVGDYTANNQVVTVASITTAGSVFVVTETLVDCGEGAGTAGTITILKGGIASGATVYVNYTYIPLTARTYTTGGYTSKTPRIVRLTNTNALDLTWTMLVYKAYIGDGLNMAFPSDEDRNPVPCPITFVGKLDTSRTIGDQLFAITDEQDTD